MAVTAPVEKENAAIDMNIQMAVDDLSEILHKPVEEVLPQFLQSRTCATLYNRASKLWWDGPSAIVDLYLEELASAQEKTAADVPQRSYD